jgi:hypothetical protein
MIRVKIDDGPPDPDELRPSWEPMMFDPMCAESLAVQRELFAGHKPEPSAEDAPDG